MSRFAGRGSRFAVRRSRFDHGSGPPVVIVQGLHGRWGCRTISYSLAGDIGSGERMASGREFDAYVRQLGSVIADAGLERTALCGISFGGYVVLRYAALYPERVTSLMLASSPAPGWAPTEQQSRWISRPWLSTPAFVGNAPARVWPEVSAALPRWADRVAFMAAQSVRAVRAPMIPSLMAERISMARQLDFRSDCARIRVPTLVVTGEEPLDRVVPVANTQTFCDLIPGAESAIFERTGHLGVLTRPSRFAELIGNFVHAHHH
jgi:pimeloyl-ACP methyl ester carboxylesterase